MPTENHKYSVPDPELAQLLADFTARISHDWADILDTRQHGDAFRGINNLPSKNAFYHDLADVLNARYKSRYGTELASMKEIGTYTIRRIFEEGDRRNYDDKTRDMLAVYLGYANWSAYRLQTKLPLPEAQTEVPHSLGKAFTFSIPKYALVALAGLLLLAAVGYYAYEHWRNQPDGDRLTVLSVSSPRAPATVQVHYDLRGLDFQKAHIVCGPNHVALQRKEGVLTFEIAVPQYSPVQLFVDDRLLAETAQNIESDGWEGFLSLTVPLEKAAFYQGGHLRLPYHPLPGEAQEEYYPAFLNFHNYGLSADAMLFETRVLNNPQTGGQWAYDVSIDLVGSGRRAFFNVLAPDAVIYARAGVGEVELKGTKHPELKALGHAMSDWCVLSMRIEGFKAVILIDGKEVLAMTYRESLGDLRGIQFYLKGSGAVDWVRVTDLESGEVKYFDDFLKKEALTSQGVSR